MDKNTKITLKYINDVKGEGAIRCEGIDVSNLLSMTVQVENTKYDIRSKHGKLIVSIDGIMIVYPVASNMIELEEEKYHAE